MALLAGLPARIFHSRRPPHVDGMIRAKRGRIPVVDGPGAGTHARIAESSTPETSIVAKLCLADTETPAARALAVQHDRPRELGTHGSATVRSAARRSIAGFLAGRRGDEVASRRGSPPPRIEVADYLDDPCDMSPGVHSRNDPRLVRADGSTALALRRATSGDR